MIPFIVLMLAASLALLSVLPLAKLPHGAIRGPAFIRQQLLALALLLLVLAALILTGAPRWWAIGLCTATLLLNAAYILKFTPAWPKQSLSADAGLRADKERHLSIITANIKLSNRDYSRLLTLAKDLRADVIVVIEVDKGWTRALAPLRASHPHFIEDPRDTGYGLALYSRLPLRNGQINEWITKGVPSITTEVQLPAGPWVKLFAVHPEPPVASHDTKGRDSEIAHAGLLARDDPLPSIVTGDLNDVAWSTTTRRFQRLSGLLDPRVGRGFYSTFHAHYPLLRWPLDHLFHDAAFRLVSMRRLPDIGSDHFPMYFSLALTQPTPAPPVDEADHDERKEVKEMIREEARRPRNPLGTDWEKVDDA